MRDRPPGMRDHGKGVGALQQSCRMSTPQDVHSSSAAAALYRQRLSGAVRLNRLDELSLCSCAERFANRRIEPPIALVLPNGDRGISARDDRWLPLGAREMARRVRQAIFFVGGRAAMCYRAGDRTRTG